MFTVIAGAYDGTLHGWQGESLDDLKLAFAFHAHESCIRCIDVSGKMACSAASDQSIQLYDLLKKKVVDRMAGAHQDEVTCLAFANSPKTKELYLLSGDAQGKILVWKTKDSKVIHELKGHKQTSPVSSISVHPSNKVALSTAHDNSLRMWDLVNGKAAPRTRLENFSNLKCACWSPDDGARYALVADDVNVLIFESDTVSETPLGVCKHPKRVNSLKFIQDVVLASASDDGIIRIIGADGSFIRMFSPPTTCRARDIGFVFRDHLNKDKDRELEEESPIVGAAFSDGTIRLWDLNRDEEEPLTVLNVGTAAHLTSLSMVRIDLPTHRSTEVEKVVKESGKKKQKVTQDEN